MKRHGASSLPLAIAGPVRKSSNLVALADDMKEQF